MKKVSKSDEEWKAVLTREEFGILRKSQTESPFSGKYNDHQEKGTFNCAACGTPLFSSETKYDHGSGWPSFWAPVDETQVEYGEDKSFGMTRTEVRCAVCGSHLGHIFDDGPEPSRRHFCINSGSLRFEPASSPPSASSDRSQSLAAQTEIATFAAGCFWGVEDKFRGVDGVVRTRVGYTGGSVPSPTYEMVCSDESGHAEAVEVTFDPWVVSYAQLLEFFFLFHDPTQVDRQGPDVGTQYRSAIFYHDEKQKAAALRLIETLTRSGRYERPIATQVLPASEFYEAEPYHQQYREKLRKKT